MWGKQKPHTDMYEVLTDSTNNFCASRRYVLISICFRFTIALRMEPCFFLFLNEMIDNKKSCKRWCLQDFSSSPSWARTNNPTVNSRVLYHWAIEDYSFFLLSRLPSSSSSPLPHTYDTPTDSSARASHVPSKLHTRNFQSTLSLHLCLSPSPWSCPRPISCGQLHTLLYFHLRPIYLVVFKGSYYFRRDISSWGGLHA